MLNAEWMMFTVSYWTSVGDLRTQKLNYQVALPAHSLESGQNSMSASIGGVLLY
jgi:hypothetical protein